MQLTPLHPARSGLDRVFVTTATSIAIFVITLGSGVALARGLEPKGRGELALAMLWPLILAGLAGLSVAEAVAYHSAHGGPTRAAALPSALTLGAVQSIAAMVVGWFLLPYLLAGSSNSVVEGARFFLPIIPLQALTLYPQSVLQAAEDLRAFNLARSVTHVTYTVSLLVLWALGRLDVRSALSASVVSFLIMGVISVWFAVRPEHGVTWKPELRVMRTLLRFGWRVHVGQVAGLAAVRADLVALSFFSSASTVGLYVAATTVGSVVSALPVSASMVLLPTFARLSPDEIPSAIARLLWLGVAFLAVAIVVILTVLPVIMVVLLGEPFRPAMGVARIAGVAAVVRGCGMLLASALRGLGKPLQSSFSDVLTTSLLVVLLAVLVPPFGAEGAASAVLASGMAGLALQVAYLGRSSAVSASEVIGLSRQDLRRVFSSQTRTDLAMLLGSLRSR